MNRQKFHAQTNFSSRNANPPNWVSSALKRSRGRNAASNYNNREPPWYSVLNFGSCFCVISYYKLWFWKLCSRKDCVYYQTQWTLTRYWVSSTTVLYFECRPLTVLNGLTIRYRNVDCIALYCNLSILFCFRSILVRLISSTNPDEFRTDIRNMKRNIFIVWDMIVCGYIFVHIAMIFSREITS